VGIAHAADLQVGKFSRGMKQRLGIADVLIKEPKLAIFDEATAGLDPEGISQILDLLAGLSKHGMTIIMTSHRLFEVQRICRVVGILSKGKLVAQGSVEELGRQKITGGRYSIEIEIGRPSSELVEALRQIKGINQVDVKDNKLTINSDADIRAEISKLVIESGVPLIGIKVQEFNLDDIYMKYFHEEEQKAGL